MTDRKRTTEDEAILDRNVEQLLTRAHEPPRIDPDARSRILRDLTIARAPGEPKRAIRWPSRRVMGIGGAALAAAAAVVFVIARPGGDSSPEPAAYANAERAPQRVVLDDGTELILNAGTELTVTGRHLELHSGEVLLDVAKADTPFVVTSVHGRVEVLGTRFVVDADTDETVTSVVRGTVRIENVNGAETLRAGEQGVLRWGATPVRRSAPRLSHLVSWARAARAEQPEQTDGAVRKGTLLARNPQWQQQDFPLPMRRLDVDVHVENQVARVAIDQTFFNTQNQQLEGVYRFPLPPDAAISRLAMFVNGKRMESAIVERMRGREIYEGIVYRRRDPALLEWMSGNLFKVRIFPLPARQEKRILLSYTQSLTRLYDDYELEVPVPEVDAAVGSVRYNVHLVDCADCTITSTSHDIRVVRDGDDARVSFEADDYVIGDDLLLSVRDPSNEPRVAVNGNHFMVRAKPSIASGELVAPAPRRWVVLHDTSASRGTLERKAQTYLIDRFLREADEGDEVAFVAFDATIRRHGDGFERIGDVDTGAVSAFLERESYDGVGYTDLEQVLAEAVDMLGAAGADGYEPHILYLGDGIVTGGERTLETLRQKVEGSATVVAVAVGDSMDAHVLRSLAAATGGMFTAMNPGEDLGWRAFDLIAALNTPRITGLQAALVDGEGVELGGAMTYASRTELADGEEVSVVSLVGGGEPAAVKLTGMFDGSAWSQTIDLAAARRSDEPAGYLPRLWAQQRVDALIMDDAAEHKSELTELGTRNFLMTPYTSLLVLENDAMYEQYDVDRDTKPGWAAYDVPDEIEVVTEPIGATKLATASPDTILVRSPIQILQVYSPYGYNEFAGWDEFDGRGAFAFDGDDMTVVDGLSSGGGEGLLLTLESADALGAEQGLSVVEKSVDEGKMGRVADDRAAAVDVTSTITTGELRSKEEASKWTVHGGTRTTGGMYKQQVAATGVAARGIREDLAQGQSAFSTPVGGGGKWGGRARDTVRARRISSRGPTNGRYYNGYYYYNQAPTPVALHYAEDYRLADLTEFVPALFFDGYDIDAADMVARASGRTGSMSDGARALLGRARARQTQVSYRWDDGQVIFVDGAGRFRVEREMATGLSERIVFDGDTLHHVYDELGLAVKRDVGDTSALLLNNWLPFVVPDLESLARWYHVTTDGARTVRLQIREGDDAPALEMVLDDELRIVELATVVGGERTVGLRMTYGDDSLTVTAADGTETTVAIGAGDAISGVDTGAVAVVDMPLSQPAVWTAVADTAAAGTDGWRRAQHQRLASYAALGQSHQLIQIANQLREHGPLSRGELVLASVGIASAERKVVKQLTKGAAAGDPVAAYLRASEAFTRTARVGVLDDVARANRGTLVGMLAEYRAALSQVWQSKKAFERRVLAFLDRYDDPTLSYVITHRFSSSWSYQHPNDTVALWDRLADTPMGATAEYEAARVYYNAGRYDDAADRFDALFDSDDSNLLRVDNTVRWAYQYSSRGAAGWQLLWTRWRARALHSDDPVVLERFMQAAMAIGATDDIDRVVVRMKDLQIEDPLFVLALADSLTQTGRNDQAAAVLAPWVDRDAGQVTPAILARAATIAEGQGRFADAADYLERAMERFYEEATDLSVLRSDYSRLVMLRTRVAQSSTGTERDSATDAALHAIADWRRVDPDNATIDSLAGRLLYSVQQPERAWRYISTVIERAPMEGDAYSIAASALEEEGLIAEAGPLWERAFEVDGTNPTWLLRRAQGEYALGNTAAGDALIDQIMDSSWHERFANVTWQAEALAKRRKAKARANAKNKK